jgi:hypothetical protein
MGGSPVTERHHAASTTQGPGIAQHAAGRGLSMRSNRHRGLGDSNACKRQEVEGNLLELFRNGRSSDFQGKTVLRQNVTDTENTELQSE